MTEPDYTGLTDEQASTARQRDKGLDWRVIHYFAIPGSVTDAWGEAMHDRDRFQRERDYWREQAEQA